jgi:hypothetical protein
MAGDYCKVYLNSVLLEGVLNVNIDDGRRNEVDSFRGGTCSFDYLQKKADGSANTVPQIANTISVWLYLSTGTEVQLFSGVITDVDYYYNIAQINTYRVSVIDLIGQIGQAEVSNISIPAGQSGSQVTNLIATVGLSPGTTSVQTGLSQCSGYTYTGNVLDQLNKITSTEQGYLNVKPDGTLEWLQRNIAYSSTVTYGFSFTESANQFRYDQVEVASAQSNRFNYIVVQPDGLANATSSYAVTGTKKTISVSTVDQNTTQAGYLADYLYGKYSNTDADVQSVSTTVEAQNVAGNKQALVSLTVNTVVQVGFTPSTSGYGVIIGRSISGTPSGTRVTYYLSGVSLVPFLILDNTIQGKLNYGKLSF